MRNMTSAAIKRSDYDYSAANNSDPNEPANDNFHDLTDRPAVSILEFPSRSAARLLDGRGQHVAHSHATRVTSHSVARRTRRLEESDAEHIFQHLTRLDGDDRLLRFGAARTDQHLMSYVDSINFHRDIVVGMFSGAELIGVCHLAVYTENGHPVAEAGISLQKEFRGSRLGSELLDCGLGRATSWGITRVYFQYLRRNGAIGAMCAQRRATIIVNDDECCASIVLLHPNAETYIESHTSRSRSIEVFKAGPVEGRTVILVHGAGGDAWQWRQHLMPYLAQKGHRCISFSLGNHGLSPRRADCRVDDYVQDLAEVVDEEPVANDASPTIVGHSLGGVVVQRYLERNKAERAILLAPIPPAGLHGHELELAQQALRSRFARDILAAAMTDWNPIDISSIDTPITIIGGEMDRVVPLKAILHTAQAYGTVAHIIPDCGHALMLGRAWRLVADVISTCIQPASAAPSSISVSC